MNRRPALVLAAAGAALCMALAACTPRTTVSTTTEPPRTVAVSATGSADATPDAARASLTVTATDPTSAEDAQAAAAGTTTKVLDSLKAAGIDEADISTQSISVGPTYTYPSSGEQTLSGYQASQSISINLRDLATAGATLDAAVAAGGNSVRIDSLTTYVVDPTVAANAARAQAVDIARKQAEQYAQLLGFTLGPVARVSESTTSSVPPPVPMADSVAAEKATTPVSPGTTQVSVTIEVSWSIE